MDETEGRIGAVRLRGTLDGHPPLLTLDVHGLWLMAGQDAVDGHDVLKTSVAYRYGTLADEIEIRGETYGIPTGRGPEVRRLLSIGRLRGARDVPRKGPLLEYIGEVETAFLSGWLQEGELLLAFLHTATSSSVDSELGPATEAEARVVWTDRRAGLVTIGELGDVRVTALDAPLEIHAKTGRDLVRCGDVEWKTTLFNESRYARLVDVWLGPREKRIRCAIEAALDDGKRELARVAAGALDGPLARVECALYDMGDAALEVAGFAESMKSDALVAWADAWGFDVPARVRLRDALLSVDPASEHAHALDRWLRSSALAQDKALAAQVEVDIAHARRLHAAGRAEEAHRVLQDRLGTLASPEAADLVPHGTETTEREPQLRARVALLEALRDLGEASAVLALARLEPLRRARVAELAASEHDGSQRVLSILERGLGSSPSPPGSRAVFDETEISLLRHPIGRSDTFIAGVQALVARADVPDHTALKAYCPRLVEPTAVSLFDRACARLDLEAAAFVSQGDRALGCRAHDADGESFVILGGVHLDPTSSRHLPPAALVFSFGAELAHLRFGHTRVTASDLWTGAFDVGVSGFDLLLGAIPVLGRWRLGEGVSKLANAVKDGTVGKLARRAGRMLGVESAEQSGEHLAAGQLLAAHRLMQLTADRVGLVLSGDPGAAIHAMFALHASDVLERLSASDLHGVLSERNAEGSLVFPELAVRVGALLSFWLSDDYRTLSRGNL